MGWLSKYHVNIELFSGDNYSTRDIVHEGWNLLGISLLYITVIIGIGKETPIVDTVYILLHRRVIQRQAKPRSQEWVVLRIRGL